MNPAQRVGLALGVVFALGIAIFLSWGRGELVERPEARGQTGNLYAYGQTQFGPRLLRPDSEVQLRRPQEIVFEWRVEGNGPRIARIETEVAGKRAVVFEEKLWAPATTHLEYVLKLGDDAPNELDLLMTVEAPHRMAETARVGIRLFGTTRTSTKPT